MFVYGNIIACVPTPFIPHFSPVFCLPEIFSVRNVPTSPSLCSSQGISSTFPLSPLFFNIIVFLPSVFSHNIRFLTHILQELNVIRDVFEQIGPLEGLLVYDFGAKYKSTSFVMRVQIEILVEFPEIKIVATCTTC